MLGILGQHVDDYSGNDKTVAAPQYAIKEEICREGLKENVGKQLKIKLLLLIVFKCKQFFFN